MRLLKKDPRRYKEKSLFNDTSFIRRSLHLIDEINIERIYKSAEERKDERLTPLIVLKRLSRPVFEIII
jgi:hypothetical protein